AESDGRPTTSISPGCRRPTRCSGASSRRCRAATSRRNPPASRGTTASPTTTTPNGARASSARSSRRNSRASPSRSSAATRCWRCAPPASTRAAISASGSTESPTTPSSSASATTAPTSTCTRRCRRKASRSTWAPRATEWTTAWTLRARCAISSARSTRPSSTRPPRRQGLSDEGPAHLGHELEVDVVLVELVAVRRDHRLEDLRVDHLAGDAPELGVGIGGAHALRARHHAALTVAPIGEDVEGAAVLELEEANVDRERRGVPAPLAGLRHARVGAEDREVTDPPHALPLEDGRELEERDHEATVHHLVHRAAPLEDVVDAADRPLGAHVEVLVGGALGDLVAH